MTIVVVLLPKILICSTLNYKKSTWNRWKRICLTREKFKMSFYHLIIFLGNSFVVDCRAVVESGLKLKDSDINFLIKRINIKGAQY